MAVDKLSAIQIKNAAPKDKPYKLTDGRGLYLHVFPNGSKYWRLNFRLYGKQRTFAVGSYPDLSLREAREKVNNAKELIREGQDPTQEKRAEKRRQATDSGITLEKVANEWIDLRLKQKKCNTNTADDVMSALSRHVFQFKALGITPISSLKQQDINALFNYLDIHAGAETVKRSQQRLSSIFCYAMIRNYCDADLAAPFKGQLKIGNRQNHASLKPSDMPAFLNALNRYSCTTQTRLAFYLLIHTFCRTSEVIAAEWSEIDFTNNLWTIPAERMKMRRKHIIPLTPQTRQMLDQLQQISGDKKHLFPNNKNPDKHMSNNTFLMIIRRMGYQSKATAHGFRSLASTVLNEQDFDKDLIEIQLSHVDQNQIRDVYNKAEHVEKRRGMMAWYSDWLDSLHGFTVISDGRLKQV